MAAKQNGKKEDRWVTWLRSLGAIPLSMKFGCHVATVEAWIGRRRLPLPHHMMQLVEMGAGAFGYEDIIEPFFAVNQHLIERHRQG